MSEVTAPGINTELMRLAVEALRSGRFKKGVGVLHRVVGNEPGPDDEYCCLGVLSVIGKENGCPVTSVITGTGQRREQFGSQESEFLSDEVMRCYGFTTNNPELITPQGLRTTATHWNDSGLNGDMVEPRPEPDFTAIADGFERTYLSRT
jgi:hypothetical protein